MESNNSKKDDVIRQGVLFKKGSGDGPLGRKNWKARFFQLTSAELRYFTSEDGKLKGCIDLRGCTESSLQVMPVEDMKTGTSASSIWRVAIESPQRRLLIAAASEREMNNWCSALDSVLKKHRLSKTQVQEAMPTEDLSNFISYNNVFITQRMKLSEKSSLKN